MKTRMASQTVISLQKVKNKKALVVMLTGRDYRVYVGVSLERLSEIFPEKTIYAWRDQGGWVQISK